MIGRKADPNDISKAMRTAKDSNGERMFDREDFLTSQQIACFQAVSEEETPGEDLHSVLSEVWSEVNIQHSHPIIYDSDNIYI